MPKFDVGFYIRHYNGSITIDAETERDAQLIVENMNSGNLEEYTSSVEVYVEEVYPEDSQPEILPENPKTEKPIEESCQQYHDGKRDECPVCKYPTHCNGYHTNETYAENPDMYDGWLGACTNCPEERAR